MTRPQLSVQIIRKWNFPTTILSSPIGTPVFAQLDRRGQLKLTRARYPIYDAIDRRQTTKLRGPSPSTTGREERTKTRQHLESKKKKNTLTERNFCPPTRRCATTHSQEYSQRNTITQIYKVEYTKMGQYQTPNQTK
jgi:hypothetical protein